MVHPVAVAGTVPVQGIGMDNMVGIHMASRQRIVGALVGGSTASAAALGAAPAVPDAYCSYVPCIASRDGHPAHDHAVGRVGAQTRQRHFEHDSQIGPRIVLKAQRPHTGGGGRFRGSRKDPVPGNHS